MPTYVFLLLFLCIMIGILMLIKPEKLVRLTFGSYLLLVVFQAGGTLILQYAALLNSYPDTKFLGISYTKYASFLLDAQPTILLVVSGLLLWFFVQSGQLRMNFSDEGVYKIGQTLLWSVFAVGALISFVYFSLSYFKGGVYEWLFLQPEMLVYTQHLPICALGIGVLTLICASRIDIEFSFKAQVVSGE